jgi:hypothetical protein
MEVAASLFINGLWSYPPFPQKNEVEDGPGG